MDGETNVGSDWHVPLRIGYSLPPLNSSFSVLWIGLVHVNSSENYTLGASKQVIFQIYKVVFGSNSKS